MSASGRQTRQESLFDRPPAFGQDKAYERAVRPLRMDSDLARVVRKGKRDTLRLAAH